MILYDGEINVISDDPQMVLFLDSMTAFSEVEIKNDLWWDRNGKRMKVHDRVLRYYDMDVANLAAGALRDDSSVKSMLARALGKLERDYEYDRVNNLMSVMYVIERMKIKPSEDDISGWLEVRDYIEEIDDDYCDPEAIAGAVSYIETACLKARHGDESTPKRHAATI
jgi:hypothetical protein